MNEFPDFPIDLYDDTGELPDPLQDELYEETEQRLLKLSKGHRDITAATIHISRPEHSETAYDYEVTVSLSVRPDNIAATEHSDDVRGALRGALTAAERQVRQKREKLRGY